MGNRHASGTIALFFGGISDEEETSKQFLNGL